MTEDGNFGIRTGIRKLLIITFGLSSWDFRS